MEVYTTDRAVVKKNLHFLSVLSDGCAEVRSGPNRILLPDVPYSRWWLRVHCQHLKATEEAKAWYAKHDPTKLEPIKGFNGELWQHQKLSVNRMHISSCALLHEMGVGKSACAIAYSLMLYEKHLNFFLIVCPPTVFTVWIDELAKFIAPEMHHELFIAHGPHKAKILAQLRTSTTLTPKFIVTSYETLESIREILQTLPISAIFFDESSKIKNYEAKRTKSCHALTRALPNAKRFVLSGSPATKSCLGLFSQLEILAPGASGHPTFTSFEKKFAVSKLFAMVKLPHGRITSVDAENADQSFPAWLASHKPPGSSASYLELGYSFSQHPKPPLQIRILNFHRRTTRFINQDVLHATVNQHAYTVFKDQVFDLPPKTYTKRLLDLPDEQKKAYHELLETNRTVLLSTQFSFHSSPHIKIHQLVNGFIRNEDGAVHFFKTQPKLLEIEQILSEAGKQKVIIWSALRPQLAQITQFINKELEIPALELHGGTPVDKRTEIVHQFSDPAGPQILVANPEVGGMGLNLTASALEVFASNWYKSDTRKQAEDRIWRPGQSKNVSIIDLVVKNTLEVGLLHNLLKDIDTERQIISMGFLKGE